jgi:putative hemolysin
MTIKRTVSVLAAVLFLAGCAGNANMANPASVYCEENKGKVEIRDEAGGQVGYCVFEDTSECEEFAFMNGECKPGDSLAGGAGLANPASVYCEEHDGKLEIRDEAGGQVGYCVFADTSECEEFAYMNGECKPGDSLKD